MVEVHLPRELDSDRRADFLFVCVLPLRRFRLRVNWVLLEKATIGMDKKLGRNTELRAL